MDLKSPIDRLRRGKRLIRNKLKGAAKGSGKSTPPAENPSTDRVTNGTVTADSSAVAQVSPPEPRTAPPSGYHNGDILKKDKPIYDPKDCYCRHGVGRQSWLAGDSHDKAVCQRCGRCEICSKSSISGEMPRCAGCKARPGDSLLLALPPELLTEIYQHLELSSALTLKLCCKYFHYTCPVPVGAFDRHELLDFLRGLRASVPSRLELCVQCAKYHSSKSSIFYTWLKPADSPARFCLRYSDRTGLWPDEPGLYIGGRHYVCRHCLTVRANSGCRTCGICKSCAKGKVGGKFQECIDCDEGKSFCWCCRNLRARDHYCQRCGKCEKCNGLLFQFGNTHCQACTGIWSYRTAATRRVLVETGPGYEIFYTGETGYGQTTTRPIRQRV